MVNVICMKWGVKYGPEYVNKLRSMVRRHLRRPHRFVCFTDDATGLDLAAGIEALPLPPMNLPPDKERGWRKLSTFGAPLADLKGPVLFLDVDVVIVGPLDDLFDLPGRFRIIHDWAKPWRATGNSSVYRFEAGAHPEILAYFIDHIDQVKRRVRNEQEYLTYAMKQQKLLAYWPVDWCVSFKHSCLPGFPLNYLRVPRIPEKARIVVFHGHPNPDEAVVGKGHGLLRHVRPTPWITEHWR